MQVVRAIEAGILMFGCGLAFILLTFGFLVNTEVTRKKWIATWQMRNKIGCKRIL